MTEYSNCLFNFVAKNNNRWLIQVNILRLIDSWSPTSLFSWFTGLSAPTLLHMLLQLDQLLWLVSNYMLLWAQSNGPPISTCCYLPGHHGIFFSISWISCVDRIIQSSMVILSTAYFILILCTTLDRQADHFCWYSHTLKSKVATC